MHTSVLALVHSVVQAAWMRWGNLQSSWVSYHTLNWAKKDNAIHGCCADFGGLVCIHKLAEIISRLGVILTECNFADWEFQSLKWGALRGNSATSCSEISDVLTQKWMRRGGSRRTPGICPQVPGPAGTQGISACPPLQLQHPFFCAFCAEEKWPIFIFSTWQNGPSFTSEISTGDFCHPCIKNELQVTTTLTTFPSVTVSGFSFLAEWRASLNDTSIAASASFTAFANNCCCWKPALNLFTADFCQMEVRGQTFGRFGDVFPAFPDGSARTGSLINTDHRIISKH